MDPNQVETLKAKTEQYKAKLAQLEQNKEEISRQLIIADEQYKQYKEKIEQAFGTSDTQKLQEIAEEYLKEIEILEGQINGHS